MPIEAKEKMWLWQEQTFSRNNGSFSLNVDAGEYLIQARRPWDEQRFADSAFCRVKVDQSREVVEHSAGCEDGTPSTSKIKLKLREPNVKFKLVDVNSSPVAGANIGVGYGSWSTWTNSNSSGEVSLFIDSEAIGILNPWISDTSIPIAFYLWVEPPWNSENSNIVRWSCSAGENKPICSQLSSVNLGTDYAVRDLGTITALGPNAVVSITNPKVAQKARFNTWVTIYEKFGGAECGKCSSWVGYSSVDSAGKAKFRLSDDPTKRFFVEVNPSWEDRSSLSRKFHDNGGEGYTLESLNTLSFDLAEPNLKLKIKSPYNNDPSKWATVSIDVVDSTTFETLYGYRWLQLDERGEGGVHLDRGASYRLSIRPGNGQIGSTTQCIVTVEDSDSAVVTTHPGKCGTATVNGTNLVLTLSSGNVTGRIVTPADSPAVTKVIVYANYQETTTTAVVATADSNGTFSMELATNRDWTLKVIPLSDDGTTPFYQSKTITISATDLGNLAEGVRLELPDILLEARSTS